MNARRIAASVVSAVIVTTSATSVVAIDAVAQTAGSELPRRVEIHSRADGAVLVGNLYSPLPSGGASVQVPGIVLLGVAGPNDRALSFGPLAPFDALARSLAGEGIAVLSFDDRGVGESTGDWTRAGYNTLVEDALSALEVLAKHSRVDESRVGFFGLSEGAGIAMMAAARQPDRVRFLLLGSPPGLRGDEALRVQFEAMVRSSGVTGESAARARAAFQEFIALARAANEPGLEAFLSGPGASLVPPYEFVPRTPAAQAALFAGPWYRSQLDYDPGDFLGRIVAPTLVIGGALDPILPPDMHHPPLKDGMRAADVEFHVLSNVNHLLLPAETGSPVEYRRLTKSLDPRLPDLILRWLREHRSRERSMMPEHRRRNLGNTGTPVRARHPLNARGAAPVRHPPE